MRMWRSFAVCADRKSFDKGMIPDLKKPYFLAGGLDTVCGESGSGLSEGQCQRIAIARAVLRPGGILLLDEATSSLDPQTESILMENLRALPLTVIFVSHREAVMAGADQLLRLEA